MNAPMAETCLVSLNEKVDQRSISACARWKPGQSRLLREHFHCCTRSHRILMFLCKKNACDAQDVPPRRYHISEHLGKQRNSLPSSDFADSHTKIISLWEGVIGKEAHGDTRHRYAPSIQLLTYLKSTRMATLSAMQSHLVFCSVSRVQGAPKDQR